MATQKQPFADIIVIMFKKSALFIGTLSFWIAIITFQKVTWAPNINVVNPVEASNEFIIDTLQGYKGYCTFDKGYMIIENNRMYFESKSNSEVTKTLMLYNNFYTWTTNSNIGINMSIPKNNGKVKDKIINELTKIVEPAMQNNTVCTKKLYNKDIFNLPEEINFININMYLNF